MRIKSIWSNVDGEPKKNLDIFKHGSTPCFRLYCNNKKKYVSFFCNSVFSFLLFIHSCDKGKQAQHTREGGGAGKVVFCVRKHRKDPESDLGDVKGERDSTGGGLPIWKKNQAVLNTANTVFNIVVVLS